MTKSDFFKSKQLFSSQTGLADSQSVLGEDQQKIVELTKPDMTKLGLSDDLKMERGGGVKWL